MENTILELPQLPQGYTFDSSSIINALLTTPNLAETFGFGESVKDKGIFFKALMNNNITVSEGLEQRLIDAGLNLDEYGVNKENILKAIQTLVNILPEGTDIKVPAEKVIEAVNKLYLTVSSAAA